MDGSVLWRVPLWAPKVYGRLAPAYLSGKRTEQIERFGLFSGTEILYFGFFVAVYEQHMADKSCQDTSAQ